MVLNNVTIFIFCSKERIRYSISLNQVLQVCRMRQSFKNCDLARQNYYYYYFSKNTERERQIFVKGFLP